MMSNKHKEIQIGKHSKVAIYEDRIAIINTDAEETCVLSAVDASVLHRVIKDHLQSVISFTTDVVPNDSIY